MLEPRIVVALRNIVGADGIIDKHEQLRTYESDGLTAEGCDVVVPPGQGCCGALCIHSGREEEGLNRELR